MLLFHFLGAGWCYRHSMVGCSPRITLWCSFEKRYFLGQFNRSIFTPIRILKMICLLIRSLPITFCCITWPLWANGITPRALLSMSISCILHYDLYCMCSVMYCMYLSIPVWCKCSYGVAILLLVGGAIGGWAHCNGWNGIDGTESSMWFPYVWCVWYCSIYSIPAITMSLSSHNSSHQPPLLQTFSAIIFMSFFFAIHV